ncbi:hypothetical protein [Parapedobacter sp. 10938]|uniref:hypothetical protein n=1 Tax=Parapedobacter flavus TaxID=3110225 RepID=UPI002DBF9862|nr:hypothetical protein [Parapedobacter sp. 10938]MEC3880613.1 hypothetical protein [Parapedobacter sp. 10938]
MSLQSVKTYARLLPLLVYLILGCAYLYCIRADHNWGDDFAFYFSQARALTQHSVDRLIEYNLFCIKASSAEFFSPVLAPWGWPILLSVVYLFFGANIVAFKVLVILFFFLFLGMLYLLFKNKLNVVLLHVFIFYLFANTYYFDHTTVVLSELPFLFFAALGLYLIDRYDGQSPTLRLMIVMGIVLSFAAFIRTEGVLLFGALLSVQLRQVLQTKVVTIGVWKRIGIPYISAGVFVLLFISFFDSGFISHVNHLKLVSAQTVVQSLERLYNGYGALFSPYLAQPLKSLVYGLFLLGLFSRFCRDLPISIFLIGLLAVFIIWPFHELRYLYLSFPFILYFNIQGLVRFSTYLFKGLVFAYSVAAVAVVVTAIGFYVHLGRIDRSAVTEGPYTAQSKEMFQYIREYTDSDAVVVFFRPRALTFFAERRSAMIYDYIENVIMAGDYMVLDHGKGSYFQIDPDTVEAYRQRFPTKLVEVFHNRQFTVFKILKDG